VFLHYDQAGLDAAYPVTSIFGEAYNHFELFETLANPCGLLGRAALEQMRLSRP
jgi:arylformamidase